MNLLPQLQTTSDAPGAPGLPPATSGPAHCTYFMLVQDLHSFMKWTKTWLEKQKYQSLVDKSSSDTKCPSTCQLYFEISCYYEDKQTKYTIHHIHIQ